MYNREKLPLLKYNFNGIENIEKNHSQVYQDFFVLTMLNGKRDGYYVEVGSFDPFDLNNSYLLEKDFNWTGISHEIDKLQAENFTKVRRNNCTHADATEFDYRSQFKDLNFPNQIDYLSLDIEPSFNTFKALTKMPHDEYRFSVITFEHDYYRAGDEIRTRSREYLNNLGYKLVVGDVSNNGESFEDWWIDPNVVKTTFESHPHTNVSDLFYKGTFL